MRLIELLKKRIFFRQLLDLCEQEEKNLMWTRMTESESVPFGIYLFFMKLLNLSVMFSCVLLVV